MTKSINLNHLPVWNLHFIQCGVCLAVFLPVSIAVVPVGVASMGVDVFWDPHLGGDVCCVGRGVVEVLHKLVIRHHNRRRSLCNGWNCGVNKF